MMISIMPEMGLPYFSLLKISISNYGVNYTASNKFSRRWIFGRDKLTAIHIHMLDQIFVSSSKLRTAAKIMFFLVIVLPAARLRGVRLVWTCHELAAHEGKRDAMVGKLVPLICWFADTIIVHSREVEQQLLRLSFSVRGKIVFMPHGDLAPYYARFDVPKVEVVVGSPFVFAAIGYMRWNKGSDLILRAFTRLADENARLVMTGNCRDSTYLGQLQQIAAKDPRITLEVRDLTDEEVVLAHRQADVAVFGFRECPTSGSVMTAMSLGKPVIAPRIGHAAELIDASTGWIFDPLGDEEALAGAMADTLCDRKICRSKGEAARLSAARQDWNKIGALLRAIYLGEAVAA